LHKKDHSRIRYQRVSEATGKEVPAKEIHRGFEVERDTFVVISDDELKEAAPEKSAAIEIENSSMNPRSRPFILKSLTIWSRTRAQAKPMPYCAKRSPNPGKSASRNSYRESLCVPKAQGNTPSVLPRKSALLTSSACRSTRSWSPTKSILL
jgi:hypothetical protein